MGISDFIPFNGGGGHDYLLGGLEYVLNGLIIAGALILIFSLVPTYRLIAQLSSGRIRLNWQILSVLMMVFICGYLCYLIVNWNGRLEDSRTVSHYTVPLVYFLGACFIYLVATFALETAVHVRRSTAFGLENITDPLLGIHNRRYLDYRIKQEIVRAVRYHIPLSVVLIDIDHFKDINENYGRKAGDDVLTGLGKLVLNTARNTDIVARYGGEEIMVIATNTPVTGIITFAERLRQAVADAILVPPGQLTRGETIRVTVSIGVAAVGPETGTVKALTESVTDALSRAKAQGRNIVMVNKSDAGAV
jgi:diguanylate cyclase (GGDEF)-like protein